MAPASVELVYLWVATIFKSAVADGVIASSQCLAITLPRRADAEIVPLNVSQDESQAAAVPAGGRARWWDTALARPGSQPVALEYSDLIELGADLPIGTGRNATYFPVRWYGIMLSRSRWERVAHGPHQRRSRRSLSFTVEKAHAGNLLPDQPGPVACRSTNTVGSERRVVRREVRLRRPRSETVEDNRDEHSSAANAGLPWQISGSIEMSSSSQMSVPAAVRHRWGLDRGGRVTAIDLGDGVVLLPPGSIHQLNRNALTAGEHRQFVASLDDPDLATTCVTTIVVDDHLLRDVLAGQRASDLGGLATRLATTGTEAGMTSTVAHLR